MGKIPLFVAPMLFAAASICHSSASVSRDQDVRDELLQMAKREQEMRLADKIDEGQLSKVDLENQMRLREIIESSGMPTTSRVGNDGVQAMWLIVQHADNDKPFQRWFLEQAVQMSRVGEFPKRFIAYLHDRTHSPQRYGTQGTCKNVGAWEPLELEQPEQIGELRAALGLEPLDEYVAKASKFLCRIRK